MGFADSAPTVSSREGAMRYALCSVHVGTSTGGAAIMQEHQPAQYSRFGATGATTIIWYDYPFQMTLQTQTTPKARRRRCPIPVVRPRWLADLGALPCWRSTGRSLPWWILPLPLIPRDFEQILCGGVEEENGSAEDFVGRRRHMRRFGRASRESTTVMSTIQLIDTLMSWSETRVCVTHPHAISAILPRCNVCFRPSYQARSLWSVRGTPRL